MDEASVYSVFLRPAAGVGEGVPLTAARLNLVVKRRRLPRKPPGEKIRFFPGGAVLPVFGSYAYGPPGMYAAALAPYPGQAVSTG